MLTRTRFYLTRSPDSVPSFLDALLTDLLEQAKGMDLFAPTGSRNYWIAEMCPYAQGSDHDVFVGLGVPATMVGHAPDWTHHTSEDTLEKTDPTSLFRAGVVSTVATVWLSAASEKDWERLAAMSKALRIADYSERVGRAQAFEAPRRLAVYERVLAETHGAESATKRPAAAGQVPRRLTLPPIQASALESLAGDDLNWWNQQAARFSGTGGSTNWKGTRQGKLGFRLLFFETVNFMDGRRTTAEIADLLSAEYEEDIDRAWVDRLVGILASQKLVAVQ